MEKIGTQHGFEAARIRENEYHPGVVAWDKRAAALTRLAVDHDELVDVLPSLEARLAALEARAHPFR